MRGKKGYIIGVSLIILVFGIWTINNFKYRYTHNEIQDADKVTGLKKMPENHSSAIENDSTKKDTIHSKEIK